MDRWSKLINDKITKIEINFKKMDRWNKLKNDKIIKCIIKFSTSDNAIPAFWLVHCISVTSHYTYVCPYMENINATNVKFFVDSKLGSQVSSTKIWMRKNKFGKLSTKEIQEITDNAVPVTTKRPYSSEWEYSTVRIS